MCISVMFVMDYMRAGEYRQRFVTVLKRSIENPINVHCRYCGGKKYNDISELTVLTHMRAGTANYNGRLPVAAFKRSSFNSNWLFHYRGEIQCPFNLQEALLHLLQRPPMEGDSMEGRDATDDRESGNHAEAQRPFATITSPQW